MLASSSAEYVDELKEEIAALKAEREWISVKDRLPEHKQEFLGWCDNSIDHYIFYSVDSILNVNSCNYSRKDLIGNFVTHWMPLPAPPEDE